jgi:hypothetical protein
MGPEAARGCPQEHRTDSLSAAFKNLGPEAEEDLITRYEALCAHYGRRPSRNNRGAAHENGAIESPPGHFKRCLGQALLLRGSTELENLTPLAGMAGGDRGEDQPPQSCAHRRRTLASSPFTLHASSRLHRALGTGDELEHDPCALDSLHGARPVDRGTPAATPV